MTDYASNYFTSTPTLPQGHLPFSRSASALVLELGVWMFLFTAPLAHVCEMLPLAGFDSGFISSP